MPPRRPHRPRRRISAYILAVVLGISLVGGVLGTIELIGSGSSSPRCLAGETPAECRARLHPAP